MMRLRNLMIGALLACSGTVAYAAKIGDVDMGDGGGIAAQALRFVRLTDPSVRLGLTGAVLLGLTCGLLGAFIVLRRLSLMGDGLGHSVLPGVAIGFLVAGRKAPGPIFVGALTAGIVASALMSAIVRHSRIKQDAAMGVVLSGFFGVGIVLLTRIQKLPFGNQSGLDKFLFGQAAAMGSDDITWMAVMTALAVATVLVFYKQFAVTSFDEPFAQSIGIPNRFFHYLLMGLLTVATVISIQAVGVVLVSAMLIIPAATAYLLTDRLPVMLALSALFGILSGGAWRFISFLGPSLPTGPFMVVSAATFFTSAYILSPRYGVLVRFVRLVRKRRRVAIENILKSVYHALELLEGEVTTIETVAAARGETSDVVRGHLHAVVKKGFVVIEGPRVCLTATGTERAERVVRNHRLWELYLTKEAEIASDHVHEDAEEIEHVLGEDIVRQLEEQLDYPDTGPHGRRIPGVQAPRSGEGKA